MRRFRWVLVALSLIVLPMPASAEAVFVSGAVGIIYSERAIVIAVDAGNEGKPQDGRVDYVFTFYRAVEGSKVVGMDPLRRKTLKSANVEFYGDRLVVTSAPADFAIELSIKDMTPIPARKYPARWRVERHEGNGLGRLSDPTGSLSFGSSSWGRGELRSADDEDESGGDGDEDSDYPDWWWWFWHGDPFGPPASGGGSAGGWTTTHQCSGGGPGASSCSITCGIQGVGSQTKSATCAPGLYACCRCDYLVAYAYCVHQ